MSKVIYLYNQDNISSNDKVFKIILNFFKSINSNLIIQFFNYFFNDSISVNDSISINVKNIDQDKNSYIPLNSSLQSINFIVADKFLYSLELTTNIECNFSIHLLKYNLVNNSKQSYIVNLPDAKVLEFENKYASPDKYNYIMKIYDHSLSYEIPVLKFYNYSLDFFKDNKLYVLIPFSLFRIYNKVLSISKIGPYPSALKDEILSLSENAYKDIRNLNLYNNSLTKTDYIAIKDTIGEIVNYYLDLLST